MNPAARRGALVAGVAAGVIALDQWTKSWAQQALSTDRPRHVIGSVNLWLTYNRGAAFSLGQAASPVVAAVAVALVVAVVAYSRRVAGRGASWPVLLGLGLLAGGALSNLSDRVFRHHHGAVIDFIQLASWWAIFNVADAAITVGAVTLALSFVLLPRDRVAGAEPGRTAAPRSSSPPESSSLGAGGGLPAGGPDR
jgi:signal peptidase II